MQENKPIDIEKSPKKVGISVAFCILDILEGRVKIEEVEKITSQTEFSSEEEWKDFIKKIKEKFWSGNDKGEEIFWDLFKSGKIIQPKLKNEVALPPGMGEGGTSWVSRDKYADWAKHFSEQGGV